MKKVISTEKIPIKMWLEEIDENALQQAKNLANLPFAFKHMAIMPDSHLGYGMPVGVVMATDDVIVPNAVGVDIGCGMCAVKTSLTEIDRDTLKNIMGEIRKAIPVGFNKHKERQDERLMPPIIKDQKITEYIDSNNIPVEKYPIIAAEYNNARFSLGTLGGGNHFVEIQKGDDGHIWIMIHSGSRSLGFKVAKYYDKIAKDLNEKWRTGIPKEWDLAFLPADSEEAQGYLREMQYAVDFAFASRRLMMDRVEAIFKKEIKEFWLMDAAKGEYMINIAHNYAELENHFGKNVWVHRKGATKAYENLLGIIPGSQGTNSYIVSGKGEPNSFKSCSHGAGRVMGRKQAQRELNLEEEKKILEDQGIIHAIRGVEDLDEAPSAYKSIHEVMENQKDLVDIVVKLTPLGVVKG